MLVTELMGGSTAAASGGALEGGDSGVVGAGTGVAQAQTKAVSYGRATTGGGSAARVHEASLAELQRAVDAYSGSGGLVLE
jgi:hypothetical protein